MKKVLSILLVSALLLGLAGCGKTQTDENGNEYSVKRNTYTVYPKSFPCDIDYNGETLVLDDVLLYQRDERSGSSTYNLYVIAEFDISKLNDQDQFWVTTDMKGELRITSEDNDMKNSIGRSLGNMQIEDTDTLVFVFCSQDIVSRHSYVGSDITLTLSLKEDEGEYEEVDIIYSDTVPSDVLPREQIADKFGNKLATTLTNWEYDV